MAAGPLWGEGRGGHPPGEAVFDPSLPLLEDRTLTLASGPRVTVQGLRGCWWPLSRTLRGSDFPGGSDGKASVYNMGDPGLIPGLGRFPGEGNGNPL